MLGAAFDEMGNLERAAELTNRVYESESRTLADDDPELQLTRLQRASLVAKSMGVDQAEAFGARNRVPGELVVRLRPTAIHGFAKVAE